MQYKSKDLISFGKTDVDNFSVSKGYQILTSSFLHVQELTILI